MNKRQVIVLWVIAVALAVAVIAVKQLSSDTSQSSTQRKIGDTLFTAFPGNEVATVEINGIAEQVVLSKKDGKWVVPSRDGYPANATYVNELLRTLAELKVTRALEAGPSLAPRFGMDESSSVAAQRGLTATFKDNAGNQLAKVSFGKSIDSNADDSAMGGGGLVGRYVRNHADESGFYAVKEMFPSVSADPKRWLEDGFISPDKIKSITMSQPGKSDVAWKLIRDGADAEFKLDGATTTEVLDSAAATALKSVFSYARFEDVIPADQVAARDKPETKRTVTIETFDGFTYTIAFSETKPSAAPVNSDPEAEPPATDNYFLTVDVTAELAKERKKEDGEKPEDAKAKDSAFAEQQKSLTEKLAKEKRFAGRTFEVRKSLVESLLKDRVALTTPATPSEGAANSGIQTLPGGMIARPPGPAPTPHVGAVSPTIEAVTPPISIPEEEPEAAEEKPDENKPPN